jgi:hypothetical protein
MLWGKFRPHCIASWFVLSGKRCDHVWNGVQLITGVDCCVLTDVVRITEPKPIRIIVTDAHAERFIVLKRNSNAVTDTDAYSVPHTIAVVFFERYANTNAEPVFECNPHTVTDALAVFERDANSHANTDAYPDAIANAHDRILS